MFALAAVLAVACHLALLGGVRWAWERRPGGLAPAATLQVRVVTPAPAVRPSDVAVPGASTPPIDAAPARRREAAVRGAAAKPAGRPSPPADRRDAIAPAAPPIAAVETALAPTDTDPDTDPPPVYRTRLPPSVTLRYDIVRGAREGRAEMRWHRDADSYSLDWQGRAGDAALPALSSRGKVDAAGIAPLRFVDQRPSRAAVAVNFQRDAGRITFSRKAAAVALAPGAQDRLSWLLQLASIVAAEPELREPGREVRITVAGAGGDVAVWRLRCEGAETLDGRPVLRYLREARGLYDTRAEVWLDARDGAFLPVRASWRSGPADDGVELRLREALATEHE